MDLTQNHNENCQEGIIQHYQDVSKAERPQLFQFGFYVLIYTQSGMIRFIDDEGGISEFKLI